MKKIAAVIALAAVLTMSACAGGNDALPKSLTVAVINGEDSENMYSECIQYAIDTAEKTGLPYEIAFCNSDDEVIEMLESGEADFAVPTIQRTNMIGSDYLVTVPYLTVNMCAVYSDVDYKYRLADFDGKVTAVSSDFSEMTDEENGKFAVMDAVQATDALIVGKINAYFCAPDKAAEIAEEFGFKVNNLYDAGAQKYVFAMKRGSSEMKALLDGAIYEIS